MENNEAYEKAKAKVEARIGFYYHLAVYLGVNFFLFLINIFSSPQYLWVKWPLMGWGIFVFLHFLNVTFSVRISSMKKQMIKKEMENEMENDGN